MIDNNSNNIYTNIGNQLATGNNIPIAAPVVDNSIQKLEKEIARLKNNNKLLNSKLTEREYEKMTLNQYLTKYNFHEIFTPLSINTSLYSTISHKAYGGKRFPIFEVKQDTPTSISKETLINYLEYSIGYDRVRDNYIGNINDLTHLYDGLINGYISPSSNGFLPLQLGEYTKLIKLLTHLYNKHLLPDGLKPIDKICLCDTKNISDITGNHCEQCNTNYMEHMFEMSNWNMIYTDEDKKYFYDILTQHAMDYSDLITLIIVHCNRPKQWLDLLFLCGLSLPLMPNLHRGPADVVMNINLIRFARIFSNINKMCFTFI